jgi:hypothetical protein
MTAHQCAVGRHARALKRHSGATRGKLGVDVEFGIGNRHLLTASPISGVAVVQSNGARPA